MHRHEGGAFSSIEDRLHKALPASLRNRSMPLSHAEVVIYGEDQKGHYHVDPKGDGEEIVLITMKGSANFKLKPLKKGARIEKVRTMKGSVVEMRGAARWQCEHMAGPALGGGRVVLQLGFG